MQIKNKNRDFLAERIKREQYFNMKQAHSHPFYEIYYLYSGKRKFFVNDTLYTLNKGDLLLINKNVLHRTTYISNEKHERFSLNFSDQYLSPLIERFGKGPVLDIFSHPFLTIQLNRRDYFEDLFQKMVYESKNPDEYSLFQQSNYFQELIIFLLRYQKSAISSLVPFDMSNEDIQNAAKYIRINYSQCITLEQISSLSNMSSSHFSRKFKLVTGFGFKEYLCNIRITEAIKLLLETNLSITEIALLCGFSDSNYFGDVFKKLKGISPLQYRKTTDLI
jgi:AraC-like DNA-binding protein